MSATRVSSFGAQLRHYREAAGLSQEDLAERAGLAAKAIGALERGERRRPYPRTVQMLADALQLDDTQRRQLIAAVPRAAPSVTTEGDLLVGRERELAELMAKLRAATGGHGGIVMLVGEAGIGKTRLAEELVAFARREDTAVLSGRALEGEGAVPYGPWVEAIERYAADRSVEELCRQLSFDAPAITQLVPALRARIPDIGRPEALAPNDERLRLYRAVTRFCSAIAADAPLLVFLDDLHWADRDTLGLMRYMARTLITSRVLLVGAYRDPELGVDAAHPLMTTLASLRHEIACPTIHLGGLTRDGMRAFLDREAGRALPPSFVERVARETSGNAFYAREVLRHVIDTDAGVTDDRRFVMTGVPDGVRQVVADRVHRLSPATAQALRDACAFRGGFTYPVLQQLTKLGDDELLDSLDEAVEAGLLRAPVGDAREYEFAHAIVRQALYEGLGRERRIRLERRVANALESAYAGHEDEHAVELAVHYHASAELPGASAGLPYALRAAEAARSAYANDRVVTFLRMARDLATEADVEMRVTVLTQLALAEAETVRSLEAFETAQQALSVMAAGGVSARARAEFIATVAHALRESGAAARLWDPLVDQGLELVAGQHDALWARLCLLCEDCDHYDLVRTGLVGSAVWTGQDEDAAAVARTSGDESDYAMTLDPLAWRTREETDAIHARVGTWTRPVAILNGLEIVMHDLVYTHGDFAEGRRVAEQLLARAHRWGSLSAEAEARTQLAWCVLTTGDFAAARARMEEAEEAVARLGPSHRLHLVPISFAVGLGYYLDAEWNTVARAADAFARTTETQSSSVGLAAAAYAALALARAERHADARTWLRDIALASERALATTYLQSRTLVAAAAACWEIGFADPATTYRRLLLDLERAGAGDPASFGTIELALARVAALLGAYDEAHDRFARVAAACERANHRALRAIVAYDTARALLQGGTRGERPAALITSAVSTFDALEMRGWAKRARALR